MTASSTLTRNDYIANGATTIFPYTYRIDVETEIAVFDESVPQTLGVHYTVSGVGAPAGGSVTFLVAPLAGHDVSLLLQLEKTQGLDLVEHDPMPAEEVEKALDKLTRLIQVLDEVDQRTLKYLVASLFRRPVLPDPEAGKFLRWKTAITDGAELENIDSFVTAGALGIPVAIGDGGTGATTVTGARANLSTQATIASAATLPVTAESYQLVTGATTITQLASQPAGTVIVLRFTGAPLVTHHATDLILLGGVSYQAAAGDLMVLVSEGAGDWREVWRRPVTNAASPYLFGGTGVWSLPALAARGYLWGLTVANNVGDPTNDLDIGAGEGSSDDATQAARVVLTPGAMTKQLDAVWAAGSAAGMRVGALADGTWHLYAFRRSNGTDDYFAEQSLTPTIPDGGTKKRRIASFLRTGGALVAFRQRGDEFLLASPVLDVNAANPGTSAVLRTLSVPTGITIDALVNWLSTNSGVADNFAVYVSAPDVTDVAASLTVAPLANVGVAFSGDGQRNATQLRTRTNTSAQVRTRAQFSDANTTLRGATVGWIDDRGRSL